VHECNKKFSGTLLDNIFFYPQLMMTSSSAAAAETSHICMYVYCCAMIVIEVPADDRDD
jgi:hypothetical protein